MTHSTVVAMSKIAARALSTRATLWATYRAAEAVLSDNVPGDFVECGVFAGAQVAAMACALMDAYKTYKVVAAEISCRRIHMFDTFSGIPRCGEHDHEFIQAGKLPGESACSMEQVEGNMRGWDIPEGLFVYHPGLFQVTVPAAISGVAPPRGRISQIALLRLDGDLYESTKACMPLIDLVAPGGWIIVDDFHLSGCRKAIHEKLNPGPIYFQKT